jgi:copper homeostasis protein
VHLVVRDIAVARRRGAAGVVVGALAGDGTVADDCARFDDAAEGLETTFHRAIDVSTDSRQALDRLADLGFTRVLTSGRRRSALDGAPLIKELATRTSVTVMACGGVRAANAATGVDDLHAAPRRPAGTARAGDVSYAGVGVPPGYDHFETDPDEVAALCAVRTA